LVAVESADPVSDAMAAISVGDLRLLGVMEYSMRWPGIENRDAASELGGREIRGGSDHIRCYEQARLQQLAIRYAERYNRTILGEIGAQ
jgi:hypothetical protein